MALLSNFVSTIRTRMYDAVEAKMRRGLAAGIEESRSVVHVDTGQTRDSIGGYYDREEMTAVLYADTRWAAHLELRFPFLRPGLAAMAREWGGNSQVQFATLPEKYHETVREKFGNSQRVIIGRRVRSKASAMRRKRR
jgi:hypothetical protein